jgi:hypothetical protein
MAFYISKVQFEISNNDGKIKKQSRTYVVEAVSVTDAETKLHGYLKNSVEPFEVKTVAESKILDVIS